MQGELIGGLAEIGKLIAKRTFHCDLAKGFDICTGEAGLILFCLGAGEAEKPLRE